MTLVEPVSSAGPPSASEPFEIGSAVDSLARMQALHRDHGDFYRVFVPGRKSWVYVVNNPVDVERVLISNHRNYTKGLGIDRIKILLGNSIMTSEAADWKRQRKGLAPMLSGSVVGMAQDIIVEANESLRARWRLRAACGGAVDVTAEVGRLTLEVLLKLIFGRDASRLRQTEGVNAFEAVLQQPTRNLEFAYRFRSLAPVVVGWVRERQKAGPRESDLLDLLMAARDVETGGSSSERALVEEVLTLVVAGYETTASALNWVWYALARHPQVQARMHAEVDALPRIGRDEGSASSRRDLC